MSSENKQNIFNSDSLIALIFSKWKGLLIIAIIAMAGSAAIAFYLPEKFKATVVLFPSQNNNLSRAFLSEQSDGTKDYLAFGQDNNADELLQILKSDALMDALEKKFHLINYYNLQNQPGKNHIFEGYYNDLFRYNVTEYESAEITVYDHNPEMAATMANEAAHLADSIIRQIIKQRAVNAYKIVKQQYDSAVTVATQYEDTLNFYRSKGILDWQYQVKELTFGYDDAIIKGNAEAAKEISDKLKTFEQYGKGFSMIENQLGGVYEWIRQARASYMEAKVNAEQSIPSFFIVDNATPADKKTYPIRALVVAVGTISALLFSIFVLLIMNRLKTLRTKIKQ